MPLYPELLDLTLWPELLTVTKRKSNPYHITDSEIKTLNRDVFPFWVKKSILELTRSKFYPANKKTKTQSELDAMEMQERPDGEPKVGARGQRT